VYTENNIINSWMCYTLAIIFFLSLYAKFLQRDHWLSHVFKKREIEVYFPCLLEITLIGRLFQLAVSTQWERPCKDKLVFVPVL